MKKILTIILDGFGMKEDVYGNAVKNAGMTNFINIWNEYPHSLLECSGKSVDLPSKEPINSELAHKTIGAGRIVKSKYQIAKETIRDKSINSNRKYREMLKNIKDSNKNTHIFILLTESLLNSNFDNLEFLLNAFKENDINNTYLHLITDGEDSSKFFSLAFFKQHSDALEDVKIATICGKYYAMDRTNDYSKTKMYYDLLVNGKGVNTPDIKRIIKVCYDKKITDAYLPPIKTPDYIKLNYEDNIIILNYGRDSMRQIVETLISPTFEEFETIPLRLNVYSLFEIDPKLNTINLLREEQEQETLSEYLGKLGLSQARIAEDIKKDSILYYFDGSRDLTIDGCENFIIKTNKVEYIEKKPEMKALNIARIVVNCMENDYDFIVANFANPDIIGHTGNFQATINSLQAIDVCLGKMLDVANDNFYKVIIIGSHANCDTIIDRNNTIITKNTLSKVPFIILDKKVKLKNGDITMIAPTILKYMDIALPKGMINSTLFAEKE